MWRKSRDGQTPQRDSQQRVLVVSDERLDLPERDSADNAGLELDAVRLMQRDIRYARSVADTTDRYFRIGDGVARFRFIGGDSLPLMTRAIAHLACEPVESPDMTAWVWDTSSAGVTLSPVLQYFADSSGALTLSPRQELKPLTTSRLRTTVQGWDGQMTMYDSVGREAWVWIDDPTKLPLWDHGAPFRSLLNWWLADRGKHCIHAGAVGTEEGAVILTGKGGSGKSTTALACIGSNLGYISDDYCVLSAGAKPEVFSLYNSGKLRDEVDLVRQPRFRSWVVNDERVREEKHLMFVHENAPEAILPRAPLRAVILPTVTPATPVLRRVPAGPALLALAPTSLLQLPGAGGSALGMMADLVRRIPCYRLETGDDIAALPPLITKLLDELNVGNEPESVSA